MAEIYKLDYLNGMTVGKGQDFNNFAEVIDYLLETKLYDEVRELLGFDSIADLAEYLTDCYGDYDEAETREGWLLDALDGEEIDEDHKSKWGDQMYDRAAGK